MQLYGPGNYEIAVNLNNLAKVRDAKGDAAGAEALYRRSLALKELLPGREHAETALTVLNLASLLLDQNRREEAPLAESANQVLSGNLPPNHPTSVGARKLLRELRRSCLSTRGE